MTYDNFLSLLTLLFVAIGMYLMGCNHTASGMWARSSARTLTIRLQFKLSHLERRLLAALGRPVQVLPTRVPMKHGRPMTIRGIVNAKR